MTMNRTDGYLAAKTEAEGRKQEALRQAHEVREAGLEAVRQRQRDELAAAEDEFKTAQAQHDGNRPETWARTQQAGRVLQNLRHFDFRAASADVDITYQAAVHAAEREYADAVRRARAIHGIIQ